MSEVSAPKPAGRKRRRRKVVEAPPEERTQDEEPQSRFAWLVSAFKLVAFVGLLVTAVGGFAYGARQFFVSTSRFSIERVEVEGSRRFGEQQLLALAGIKRGDNLFALDLEQAERELASNPWISSARISRKLPDSLKVSVSEYTAVAVAGIDSALYLVTREGMPIKAVEENDHVDYPVVTGVSAEDLRIDRARALERIADGIAIVDRYQRLPIAKAYPAQEIHMAEAGTVTLVVGDGGISFHLGKGPFRQKLLMAARVIGKLRARQQTPGIIFLDNEAHPERVVVRLR